MRLKSEMLLKVILDIHILSIYFLLYNCHLFPLIRIIFLLHFGRSAQVCPPHHRFFGLVLICPFTTSSRDFYSATELLVPLQSFFIVFSSLVFSICYLCISTRSLLKPFCSHLIEVITSCILSEHSIF